MENYYSRFKIIVLFSLVLFLYSIAIHARANTTVEIYPLSPQQQEVTGVVKDPQDIPVPGVAVSIKGGNRGVITNLDGEYSITAGAGDTLVFTYLGYRPVEVQVAGRSEINITLEEDITALDEVVLNAGYYNVTQRERTGNISRVTAEEIERQPVTNPLAAMQGRMPGVQITQTTGMPGGGFDIEIRGRNSLRADGNAPLIIVDGVPFPNNSITSPNVPNATAGFSPLNNINPGDIASIEILKDADATAIYGSRGANGVVLITTKSGQAGKTTVNVNLQRGAGEVSNTLEMLSTAQYLELRNEAYELSGSTPTASSAPELLLWDQERFTDWQEVLIGGTAEYTNAQVSISGGNENTTFRTGAGFLEETTVFPGDFSNKKFSGNLNLTHRSSDERFSATASISYVANMNRLPRQDLTSTAHTLAPNAPWLYTPEGEINWENGTWSNPIARLEARYDGEVNTIITNTNLSYELLEGLRVGGSFGYSFMAAEEVQKTPITAFAPSDNTAERSTSVNNSSLRTWIAEPQLDYEVELGELDVEFLVGATAQENERKGQSLRATGFTSDALLENLDAATDYVITGSGETNYKYRAVFGRLHLDWQDKYLLNLTGRRDGSSRFGPGREFANFGAIGAAWIFSAEPFFQRLFPAIELGKIRFSYGTTGSDQIGDYQFMDLWGVTYRNYNNQPGLRPARLVNEDFGWETNKKLEGGLELTMFKGALDLSTSYYLNRSSSQLVGMRLPGMTGFTSVQANLPATVQNMGWEFLIGTRIFQTSTFSWTSSLNLTIPENKLVEYPNIEDSPYASTYVVGQPLSIVRGYNLTGVDPETGLFEFEDLNGDGRITRPADYIELAHLDPSYYGGFHNEVRWNNLSLNFLLQFTKQEGFNQFRFLDPPGNRTNQPIEVLDRWREPGDMAYFQRATTGFNAASNTYSQAKSSRLVISDASYVRLKNVSLSYQLPSMGGIDSRIYAQGRNLLTFTDYPGLDPENAGSNVLPPLRFYTLGVEINL